MQAFGTMTLLRLTSAAVRHHSKSRLSPCISQVRELSGPLEAPPAPTGLSEPETVGRDLAKLSLIARAMRQTIAEAGAEGHYTPDLLVQLETTVNEANSIVATALEKAGRPCTLEQLAERVNIDVVPIPNEALDFRDLLKAGKLRDELEIAMVHMNKAPPKEALIDGSGKPFCRLERRERRRREFENLDSANGIDEGESSPTEPVVKGPRRRRGLPDLSEADLARRKVEMESAADIRNLLRGFDTALLEVGRVHKVTKGGTTMSIRALVAIGNRAGTAGYGEGKSDTAAHAIERACRDATRNLLYIDRYNDRTIFHRSLGKYVCSKVVLWPAPAGRGISANNTFSAIFQLFGVKDVGAKLHGPRCMANSVKALFNGLSSIRSAEEIASTRGLRLLTEDERKSRGTRFYRSESTNTQGMHWRASQASN